MSHFCARDTSDPLKYAKRKEYERESENYSASSTKREKRLKLSIKFFMPQSKLEDYITLFFFISPLLTS